MDHESPTVIEPTELCTARLLLRPPQRDDAEDEYAIVSDPGFDFFGIPRDVTPASMVESLERRLATPWSERPEFALVYEGHLVGYVELIIDRANPTAELAYSIAPRHRGKGLTTEAARVVVSYGFFSCSLAKIWARADARNVASMRVIEKCGMQREGLLRKHVIRHGERVDWVYYGVLREEWKSLQLQSKGHS